MVKTLLMFITITIISTGCTVRAYKDTWNRDWSSDDFYTNSETIEITNNVNKVYILGDKDNKKIYIKEFPKIIKGSGHYPLISLYAGDFNNVGQSHEKNGIFYQPLEVSKSYSYDDIENAQFLEMVNIKDLDSFNGNGPVAVFKTNQTAADFDQDFIGVYLIKHQHKYIIQPQYNYIYTQRGTDYFAKYGIWTYLIIVTPVLVTIDVVTGTIAMSGCLFVVGVALPFEDRGRLPNCMAIPKYYLDLDS